MKLLPADHRTLALTLVELLVVMATLALIGLFILPQLTRQHHKSSRIGCINNLKQVGLSYRLWADDNFDKYPMRLSVTNGGAMEPVASGIVFPAFRVMSNEMSTPKIVVCPEDSQRSVATNFTTDFNNTKVSYFVGLDADLSKSSMLLSGDHNLTTNGTAITTRLATLTTSSITGWTAQIHKHKGNIGLADGSVQQVTATGLQKLIANTGVATNRLALP